MKIGTETDGEATRRVAMLGAFEKAAREFSVPLSWLLAFARKETAFRNIRSAKGQSDDRLGGAWGPMQVTSATAESPLGFMPKATHAERGAAILASPAIGIGLGARYLARLKTLVGDDLAAVAAAYNAGAGAVRKGRIPTSTRERYVPKVLAFAAEYGWSPPAAVPNGSAAAS